MDILLLSYQGGGVCITSLFSKMETHLESDMKGDEESLSRILKRLGMETELYTDQALCYLP